MIDGPCVRVLAVGALLSWSTAASGDPRRVAVADGAADEAMAIRVRAELAAAGFSVVDVDAWPSDAPSSTIADMLAPADVAAALRIGEDSAEVWLVDPRTHVTALREVIRGASAEGSDDATIAVRAVEVVRAELSPRRAKRRSPLVEPEEVDPGPSESASERRPVTFDLGAGFSASPGGVPVAPTFVVGATWLPVEHVGVGALAVASPFASSVEAVEGSADVWTGLAGAGIALEPTDADAALGVRVEAGFAATWLHMVGHADPPYESGTATVFAAAAYVRPSLRLKLTPGFAVHLGAVTALAFPRPVIAFAGREAATWGRPLVVGSMGVELSP